MSEPHAPYYFKIDKKVDTYHWERSCHLNYWPADGWDTCDSFDDLPPEKTEQCNQCKKE